MNPHQSDRKVRIREPLKLILIEVELQRLHRLDMASQTFAATLWLEFLIPGGALDPDLSAVGEQFPLDQTSGAPLYRPSAAWYLKRAGFRNALDFRVTDSKIMRRGDDLTMCLQVDGTFYEIFELQDFPFDVQGLTMTLIFNRYVAARAGPSSCPCHTTRVRNALQHFPCPPPCAPDVECALVPAAPLLRLSSTAASRARCRSTSRCTALAS